MTTRLRLHDVGVEQILFGCSPAHEAVRSLHVLADVKHHPLHISWVLQARSRMPAELREEAGRFAFWFLHRPLLLWDVWPQTDVMSWPEELAALTTAPVEGFAEELIHGALAGPGLALRTPLDAFLASSEKQEQAVARIEQLHPPSVEVMRELIADPEQCRSRFTEFLTSYWAACLSPDWPRWEAFLRRDISRRARTLGQSGPVHTLTDLFPHSHVEGSVLVTRPPGPQRPPIELTPRQILLVPSHFVWPELNLVARRDKQGETVAITYALAEMRLQGQPPAAPDDLLKLLRSAGDPTRLRILQLLADRSRSTREIAGLLNLTEAAISKHLKLLQDARWVTPERHSYYVYYRLVREKLTELSTGLEQMLG